MGKFLDLDEILDTNQKVFVRNNSLKSNLLLVIQMQDRSGRKRPLKVPPTRFPICVSTQFSKEVIRECSDLRELLNKGVIVLVDPDQAEAELRSEDAREEMKSYNLSVYADEAPANAVRDSMQKLSQNAKPVVDSGSLLDSAGLNDYEVTPKIQGIVSSLLSKEKSSKETLTQLKRLKSTMTESDLTYIVKECARETQIREFAEGALADLAASPEQPFQE
jgi:hypothetical protein